MASEDTDTAELVVEGLADLYRSDERAWVVAFSGGKDSTAVLQLVCTMLERQQPRPTKPVHIVSSDTLVEAPNVVSYVEDVLRAIESFAARTKLPLHVHMVRPEPQESFWGKLIGLGYPPPTRWFRWCTTNMKIKPSRRAIAGIVAEHGSVVLLLGSRSSESSDRRNRMAARVRNTRDLNLHHEIPNAYVATPIADWETDEVWEYLFENNPPPWGRRHDEMLDLYRQAGGGECPVIMDLNTPSCGGSRFGCWTCTVVKLDRSMEGFIQSGETWMEPLNRFRNDIKLMREEDRYRMERRRSGERGRGPFTPEARYIILERLLTLEADLARAGRPMLLIRDEDLAYIQEEWSREFDLENSATKLARAHGREVEVRSGMAQDEADDRLLNQLCGEFQVNEALIRGILALEADFPDLNAYGRKPALKRELDRLLSKAVRQGEAA